jgi:ABC-type transporter Mla subunit MlaD
VNITVGHSHKIFKDGGTMPLAQTTVPVRLDQIYNSYNGPTRNAVMKNLVGFGNTFAARGSALNDTIASLPSLFGHLTPVARYLSNPSTELTRFFRNLNAFTSAVGPVAQTNVQLFADMATTFEAISHSPSDLQQTIKESPSTLQVSTQSLKVQRPFLANLATLGTYMQPATQELKVALPNINPAIEAGTRTLIRTPSLDQHLQQVMNALKNLAQNPSTGVALNGLTATVNTLNPAVRYLGPYVTVCNDFNYWFTNLAGDVDEETNFGYAQRALLMFGNAPEKNNVGSQGATAPVNGGAPPGTTQEYAHGPTYGASVSNTGRADCETGQRGYPLRINHLDPKHRNFDSDSHTPGLQGTTWTGLTQVPKGETFTRVPQLGPKPPYIAANP